MNDDFYLKRVFKNKLFLKIFGKIFELMMQLLFFLEILYYNNTSNLQRKRTKESVDIIK
ncbi:hypothetical protein P689_119131 [Candidatus Riesia pediculischaeffi PTSU]|uniref:Uncharacterized protein n=1 Tax=Candidatus Riesia pediculischaeffi PTSU TaxID=1401651 RepID=A0A0C1VJX1_9ENTR|nr:hypothetical protein P689_119131 [Candidatus Riesia pediculischaeffi PTSU]